MLQSFPSPSGALTPSSLLHTGLGFDRVLRVIPMGKANLSGWREATPASVRGRPACLAVAFRRPAAKHKLTIKQLRQDSKKSIVFYHDMSHPGHVNDTLDCPCSSWWATALVEGLLDTNSAFSNLNICGAIQGAALCEAGTHSFDYTCVADSKTFLKDYPDLYRDFTITPQDVP